MMAVTLPPYYLVTWLPGFNYAVTENTVEALIHTPLELESISHRSFIAYVLREGITVYESE